MIERALDATGVDGSSTKAAIQAVLDVGAKPKRR
jgi:hypothetical protein